MELSQSICMEQIWFSLSWSLVSQGFLSEAIEQHQNCSKLPLAVTSCQGECKSSELNLPSLAHVFHQLAKQRPMLLNLSLHFSLILWKEVKKSRVFLQEMWKNFTDDLWYFSGMIYEQNASTSLLLRFGILMGSLCHAKSSTLNSYILENDFFRWAYEYLKKYSYIKSDLNFSDEIFNKRAWISGRSPQKYNNNTNKIKCTFCSTIKGTSIKFL